jgi:hypothetical protein
MVQLAIIVAALFCGTAFWLVVQLTTIEEATITVPLQPINVPRTVILDQGWQPKETLVKFTFPRTLREEIKTENFAVEVDFSNIMPLFGNGLEARSSTPLTLKNVTSKVSNATPVELLAQQLTWTARLRHARARLEPVFVGTPHEGYELREPVFTVDERVLEGDSIDVVMTAEAERRYLEGGSANLVIRTKPISIEGLRDRLKAEVELELPADMTPLLPPGRSIHVQATFRETTSTRDFDEIPITFSLLRKDLQIIMEPETVTIRVTAPASVLRELEPSKLAAVVFSMPEQPGEQRILSIEPRITDARLRSQVLGIDALPRSVAVRVMEEVPVASPTPTPSPAPSPTPLPTMVPLPSPTPVSNDRPTTPGGFPPQLPSH